MAKKSGSAAAVNQLVNDASEKLAAEPDQNFLPFADVAFDESGRAAPRHGGRKKGAVNKKTRELVQYLRGRYSHPLEGMAQVWSRPAAELAKDMSCTLKDAAAFQQTCRRDAMPYYESKMPIAVSVSDQRNIVSFGFIDSDGMMQLPEFTEADGVDGEIIEPENNSVENQPLSEGER